MPITNIQPIIIPASSEKTFDSVWIKRVVINTPTPSGRSFAEILVCPYSTQDQSTLDNQAKRLEVPNVLEQAQTNPKIAAAMQAIIEAVDSIMNEQSQP